jgi:signal transduction histidine kinase
VHFEDFQRCIDTYVDAFNRREVFEMEYRLRRQDGVFRWILDRGTPRYLPDGTFAGYIGSCVDITERRQLEVDLRKAIKVRDEFLSIASHELRTPLTSLKLRSERLYQLAARAPSAGAPPLDPRRFERDAEVALTQVLHLVRMVDVLLDVSRISEGPLTLDRDELDIAPLVAAVADRFKEPASTAGSPIRVEIRGSATARWDRFRIEQVVTNLLSNAIKYGAGKPVDVVVDRENGSVRIVVTDRGPGIEAAHQGRLFERFARFAPARHYGGFGLGLWIARVIVEAHGGTIGVQSRPGEGAAFVVDLPLAAR